MIGFFVLAGLNIWAELGSDIASASSAHVVIIIFFILVPQSFIFKISSMAKLLNERFKKYT